MITETVGSLLIAPETIIAHGVNTIGVYNAGVARQIARRWPQAKYKYMEKYHSVGWVLGEVQLVEVGGKVIAHLAVQSSVGRVGKHIDYDALEVAYTILINVALRRGYNIAMPRIGAGLGGGDWAIIRSILERLTPLGQAVTIYRL